MIKELFVKSDRKSDELTEKMRAVRQRLAGLEQDARHPVLPRRQTYQLAPRLASVRRTLQQIKRSMGIADLKNGSMPARRRV